MTGTITRWIPKLGVGELVGVDDGIRYLFLAQDIASWGWPASPQDVLDLVWVPATGCVVEFEPVPSARGCLGLRATLVRRRLAGR